MSFNRNSNKPNKFHSFDIDTSNWPAQHRFIANLPDDVNDFTNKLVKSNVPIWWFSGSYRKSIQ